MPYYPTHFCGVVCISYVLQLSIWVKWIIYILIFSLTASQKYSSLGGIKKHTFSNWPFLCVATITKVSSTMQSNFVKNNRKFRGIPNGHFEFCSVCCYQNVSELNIVNEYTFLFCLDACYFWQRARTSTMLTLKRWSLKARSRGLQHLLQSRKTSRPFLSTL